MPTGLVGEEKGINPASVEVASTLALANRLLQVRVLLQQQFFYYGYG